MTVSAPPGVEVHHDVDSRTFTLTFAGDLGDTTTKVSTAQLIWQPPARPDGAEPRAPARDDVTDDAADSAPSAAARPPPLARILSASTDEPPETPTSPDERKS